MRAQRQTALFAAVVIWVCGTISGRSICRALAAETAQTNRNVSTPEPPRAATSTAWKRHTIDQSSRGADGVRLADVNRDGWADIATGWEEGGLVRVYVNPGPSDAHKVWQAVTVGKRKSPEDAVLADLDGDGALDVITSCEGRTMAMFVHWAPEDPSQYVSESEWRTEPIPATVGVTRWMFALPMQVDNRHGTDLIVASKSPNAIVGWLQAPSDARDLGAWTLHRLYQAGWIMSLTPVDMDGDDDADVLVSDRYGDHSGVFWLENPGPDAATGAWTEHRVGLSGEQVMFLDATDMNGDGRVDVVAAVKPRKVVLLLQSPTSANQWDEHQVEFPEGLFGTSKSVRAGDLDRDGRIDLAVTCEGAGGGRSGVFWMSYEKTLGDDSWETHDIGGREGSKYDLVELIDLDNDGDLDVLTCEESDNLGVIWYENPVTSGSSPRAKRPGRQTR